MKYVLTESAVRKLRGVLAPQSGNTGAGGAAASVSPDDFPPPFTVRWSQRQANKSGNWVVWLPDRAKLVIYSGAFVSTIGSVTAATGLPSGWYTINDADANSTAIYLVVTIVAATGIITAELSDTAGQAVTGTQVINVLVATMSVAANSGAKRTKQFVESVVTLGSGGGGGSVTLDDISLDWNSNDEAQIKDWDTGTPASSTTIAQDINAGNTTAQGTVVERTAGGVLQYKKPGTLAQLLDSTVNKSSQKILTGLAWNITTHKLVISSANITVANGVITSWTDNNDENIDTTPISDIV